MWTMLTLDGYFTHRAATPSVAAQAGPAGIEPATPSLMVEPETDKASVPPALSSETTAQDIPDGDPETASEARQDENTSGDR